MAVFQRVDKGNLVRRSIHASLVEGATLDARPMDKYCLVIKAEVKKVFFDKDNTNLEEEILKAGQKASINLGSLKADKFHIMIIPNPELARVGYIGGPLMVEPYSEEKLEYLIKAEKQMDLSKLDYLLRLYVVD